MMEVNEGLEGEVALSSGLSLSKELGMSTANFRHHQAMSTCLRVLLRDVPNHHAFPPKGLDPMQ